MSVNIDSLMADWRKKFYGQHTPTNLEKIRINLNQVKQIIDKDDSLLDVGCNIGAVYEFLGHKKYEGIDLDPDLVEKAKSRFPEANFRVCDLFDIEGQWDVVLVSRVLMHVAPFDLAMKKLLGAARKKCIFIVPIADTDTCNLEVLSGGHEAYFRRFSEHSLYGAGKCVIHRSQPYSTVIYG